jgi:xylan 1,4-beta-xylosidase
MNKVNFEAVRYDSPGDVKPIVTNLVHTFPHWHDEIEIVFSCRGELLLETGTETSGSGRVLKEGEFVVVNSAESHAVNTLEKRKKNAGNLVLMLQLSRRFIRNLYADIDTLRFSGKGVENSRVEELRKILLHIVDKQQSSDINRLGIVHGLCGAVVAILIQSFSAAAPSAPDDKNDYKQNSDRLKRIITFINEHYAERPALETAASVACVSPFYLSHLFAKAMGMPYSQYLNYVKVNMARRDLAVTGDTITDIFTRHGFNNAKTFDKVFKAYLGCTPSEYRKSYKNEGDVAAPLPVIRLQAEDMPGNYVNFKSPVVLPGTLYREYERKNIHLMDDMPPAETIVIAVDNKQNAKPLDPYFLNMTGQARASDFLRKGVQEHYRLVQKEIGFEYVRFFGVFNDEMCIFTPDGRYDWTYIDEVFDFLLEINLKPFVVFCFMPTVLASGNAAIYYYKGNITPPSDYQRWAGLVEAFTRHCVERWTLNKVKDWYFEVWNESELPDFWTGTFDDYMKLYEASVRRVKSVSTELRVGGPSYCGFHHSAAENRLKMFLDECAARNLPVDFVSAHPYPVICSGSGGVWHETLLGPNQTKEDLIWFKETVRHSAFPDAGLSINEWNSTCRDRDLAHDTAFMAVFLLHNYLSCQNLVHALCYWAATDRFEEHGLGGREFHGGFGLLSVSGFKKPQYYAFQALKALGGEILAQGSDYIVTVSSDNEIAALFWNYPFYNEAYCNEKITQDYYDRYRIFEQKEDRRFIISINAELLADDPAADFMIEKTIFNRDHGSIFDFWLKNGAFEKLPDNQKAMFKQQCSPLEGVEARHRENGRIVLSETVPAFGFALYKIKALKPQYQNDS